MKLRRLLYPHLDLRQLPLMIALALLAALIAGIYGAVHDQITCSIGPEYFTKLKFHQFAWANIGLPLRWHVAEIGFLATWWVGAIAGWFFARAAIPAADYTTGIRRVIAAYSILLACAVAGGCLGFLLGRARASDDDFSNWDAYLVPLQIAQPARFVWVAYVHNGSYLGGLVGLVAGLVWLAWIKRRKSKNLLPT
jgi:hypothetical protein